MKLSAIKTAKIPIWRGDNPFVLADSFARIYSLDSKARDLLVAVIRQSMEQNSLLLPVTDVNANNNHENQYDHNHNQGDDTSEYFHQQAPAHDEGGEFDMDAAVIDGSALNGMDGYGSSGNLELLDMEEGIMDGEVEDDYMSGSTPSDYNPNESDLSGEEDSQVDNALSTEH